MVNIIIKQNLGGKCKYIRIYEDMIILYANPLSTEFNVINKNYYLVIRNKNLINDLINNYYLPYKRELIDKYIIDTTFDNSNEQLIIFDDNYTYKFDVNKCDIAKELCKNISTKMFSYPMKKEYILSNKEIETLLISRNILKRENDNVNVDDLVKEIDGKMEQVKQDDKNIFENGKKEYTFEEYVDGLLKHFARVNNIDVLISMLKNRTVKSLYITLEGNDTIEKEQLIYGIHHILEELNKIKKPIMFISLYNLGANNTYVKSDNSNVKNRDSRGVLYNTYQAIMKTKISTKTLYVIEDIGEFIDDYNSIQSSREIIKKRQYEHALEILGDILEKNFIILNAKDGEIDRLFQIDPRLQFMYQNNRYFIPEMSIEDSFRFYLWRRLDENIRNIVLQDEEKYKKQYYDYISLNKNFTPFDNRELAIYLATYSNLHGDVVFPENMYKKETVDEALDNIIGLDKIKNKIKDFEKYMLFRIKASSNNIKLGSYNMHMVFTGNPGTGKTTIARIMAKMLFDMGIIKENKLIEVERKDLVAAYAGQTAIKTSKVIDGAIGGVLFIDEAYSLVRDHDSQHGFGDEAIATLIKAMEDRKDEIVVIFAGYKNEMAKFIEANPGIASRIGYAFDFPDYSADELTLILDKKIKNSGLRLNSDTKDKISKVMGYFSKVKNIGNGRFVDKLFQEVLLKHAKNDAEDILTIVEEDIPTVEEIATSLYNGDNMINPDEISEKSLHTTAIHEIGHALLRYKLFDSPEIVKITINSEGTGALGYVQLKANYNEYTSTKSEMLNNIMVGLGGMVAEEVFLGEFSNGNASDLAKVTMLAKNMVVKYGMSKFGYAQINKIDGEIAVLVQQEINNIINDCFEKVKAIIIDNRDKMAKIIEYLYEKKEITEEQFINIYNE